MTNALQIFDYKGFKVRTVEKNGEVWLVAKDVCDVLGLTNVTKALQGLDADELTLLRVRAGGQMRELNGINEPGLYSLVFKSNKPEAKEFSRWVRHEVLPQVRQYGMYLSPKVAELYKADPDAFSQLADRYIAERTKNAELEAENLKLKAQIDAERSYTVLGKVVLALPGAITFQEAAHLMAQHGIDIGQNRLYKYCREKKLLCSRKGSQWNRPSQSGIEHGIVNSQIAGGFRVVSMITPKGLNFISNALLQEQFPLLVLMEAGDDNKPSD